MANKTFKQYLSEWNADNTSLNLMGVDSMGNPVTVSKSSIGATATIGDLSDVNTGVVSNGQFLTFDGANWVNTTNKLENVINVAKSGGDFTSVKEALDSITDSGPTQRYSVNIAAGIYTENNPIQTKEYVAIKSIGDLQTTRIVAANPNSDLLIMADSTTIEGITLWGVTGTSSYAINQSATSSTSISRCLFGECSNGLLLNNSASKIVVTNCGVLSPTITTIRGAYCISGELEINSFNAAFGNIETLIEVSGSTSRANLSRINSKIPTTGKVVYIKDSSRVVINNASIVFPIDGIVCDGGSDVRLNTSSIFNSQNDGVRIDDIGSGTKLSVLSCTVEDSTRYDFNVLSGTSLLTGSAQTSLDKFNFVAGVQFYGTVIDTKEDDEGFNVLGELHVGIPERGTETVLGGGDSYTRGMLVYSETPGGTFSNITASASSASSSPFTFEAVGVDNSIYIASSLSSSDVLEHYGIDTKVISPAIKGSTGSIIIEYWNGSSWDSVSGMETTEGDQYYPHANDYFSATGSNHIRYNSGLAVDGWTKNDPMTLGTDYYWVRFRIDSEITTLPSFEQFKLHTSRSEINADGWIEYFGKARPIGQLSSSLSAASPFEGNMQSQDLYINEDLAVGYNDNKFTATGDKTGIEQYLPFDADTSSPLSLEWSGLFTTSHTPEFTIRWGWVKQGDVYYTTDPGVLPGLNTTTVSRAVTSDTVEEFSVLLDIQEMVARRPSGQGDKLMISMQVSTLTGQFSIGPSQITYTKWCEGGHI